MRLGGAPEDVVRRAAVRPEVGRRRVAGRQGAAARLVRLGALAVADGRRPRFGALRAVRGSRARCDILALGGGRSEVPTVVVRRRMWSEPLVVVGGLRPLGSRKVVDRKVQIEVRKVGH